MSQAAPKHDVYQAIADPTRRKRLLSDKEMPVKEITGHFSMTRTAVSKHLRILGKRALCRTARLTRNALSAGCRTA